MPRIANVSAALTLESASFTTGLKRAVDQTASSAKAIEGHLTNLKSAVAALAGGAVVSAVVGAAKRALDYASSLGEVSQQLGVTSKDLQVYRYAASQVGIDQETMDKSLAKLTKTMGEAAAGVKAPVEAFKGLGVSIRDSNGNLLTAGQVIPRLADALSTIKDPATRARVETQLFGKAGQALDTLLSGGSGAIDALRKAAERLGLVLSDDLIARSDNAADKLSEVKQVLEASIARIVAENADAIFTLANAFETAAKNAGDAAVAIRNFFGIRAFAGGTNGAAGVSLMQSATGRDALVRQLNDEIAQNQKDRASGRGNRTSHLGGLFETTNTATSGDNAVLDRQFKALVRQRNAVLKMGTAATAAENRAPKPLGSGGFETVNDNGAGAKKAASEAAAAAKKALAQENRFQDEKDRDNNQLLGLRQQLTSDVREQAAFQHEQVDFEARAAKNANDRDEQDGHIAQGKAKILNAIIDEQTDKRHAIVNRELDARLDQQELDAKQAILGTASDLLTAQEALAKTAGERRDLEMKLLANQRKQEENDLNAITVRKDGQAAYDKAQARLGALPGIYGARTDAAKQSTMGPIEGYLDGIYKSAGEKAEAFQTSVVGGLKSVEDQLTSTVTGVLKLGGVFGNVANGIISDLLRIAIQQNVTGPLAKLLFPSAAGGGSGGGIFGALSGLLGLGSAASSFSGIGSASLANSIKINTSGLGVSLPAFANGGTIGGLSGIDRNILSINGMPVARVGRGEMLKVEPNNDNARGGGTLHVVPSPYFDVVVDRRAAGVASPLAAQAAAGGSTGAQVAIARQRSRVIP